MTITAAVATSLAFLLIIHFLVLPGLRKKIQGVQAFAAVKPYAKFHLFSILRTVALAVLIGAAAVALMTWRYNIQTPATAQDAAALLDRMQGLRDAAVSVDNGLTLFVVLA